MSYSRIAGTGGFLPPARMSNADLARSIDTTDEWITSRTGIAARHVAADDEQTSDLAARAALGAIEAAGSCIGDVDLIVVATTTPDMTFPSTACIVQRKLGASRCAAFDVQAVCAGFVYALTIADRMVATGAHRCALVIGAETFSRLLDWRDRRTCVLFGDGAGAVLLRRSDRPGILASRLCADGRLESLLRVTGSIRGGEIKGHPFVAMDGQAVFRTAIGELSDSAQSTLADAGLRTSDLDWYVPHQANIRIIRAVAERIGIAPDRVVATVAEHANTSAASIPLALDAAVRDGRIRSGQLVMLQGVGGGMTWGTVLVRT